MTSDSENLPAERRTTSAAVHNILGKLALPGAWLQDLFSEARYGDRHDEYAPDPIHPESDENR
jgi:hypothetical protein